MALPMDEQRILEEMERMLAADDPRLAAKLAAFGQPSVGNVLRTRRARAVLSLLTLGTIACVASVIYMVNFFHWTATQQTPRNVHTTQSASARPHGTSRRAGSLQASNATRPPLSACSNLVTSRHCVVWQLTNPSAGQP